MNKLLILSAGHGSGDPGACANGQQEHDWNVIICRYVKSYCDKWGMPCDLLPFENGNLVNQINTVNSRYGNLDDGYALQIHLNAGGGTGTEFWVPSNASQTSQDIGSSILENVIAQTGLRNRGIKDASTNQWGRLGWTDDTTTYAGLIESWFIDVDASTEERANDVAYGISLGVCKYFGHTPIGGKILTPAQEQAEQARLNAIAEAKRVADEKARLAAIEAKEQADRLKAEQLAAEQEKARVEAQAKADAEVVQEIIDNTADDVKIEDNTQVVDKKNPNLLEMILEFVKRVITIIITIKGQK